MSAATMPSPTDQKNDAAAVMLCSILTPQPETTQLEDDEYHDLRNKLKTAGFNTSNRNLVMSTTHVPSEAVLLNTIQKSCFTIALNSQHSLYQTSLPKNFHDTTRDESPFGNQVYD